MRDYLQAHSIEFDDRNIRKSEKARAELIERTGGLAVPVLLFEDQAVVGFDPEGIDRIIATYRERGSA